MPRKPDDLLDVFRHARAAGGAERSGRPAKAPKAERAPRQRAFEGVFLAPRQLLLASSVLVLLLVLAFTVGLGVGRSGGRATAPETSLRRETRVWILRGQLPRLDATRGEALTEDRIVRELERKYGIPRHRVRVDAAKDPVVVTVGPFADEAQAVAFLAEKRLVTARLWSAFPFRFSKPEAVLLR